MHFGPFSFSMKFLFFNIKTAFAIYVPLSLALLRKGGEGKLYKGILPSHPLPLVGEGPGYNLAGEGEDKNKAGLTPDHEDS